MSIGLQAIQLSPYHAGLAEQRRKRLLPSSALSACSCPLALSGSGERLPQGSPLNPSHLRWGCCMTYCGAPDAGGSQLHTLIRRDLCSPRLVFSHPTALSREGDGYKSTPGLRIVRGLCLPQPSSGQHCARLITHFALVLSAADVLGKVKRPKGEELAKLAWLTVFFNDGQDLCKQPGGMRVCIE